MKDANGILVPGGFGVRGVDGKVACVKYARENKVPILGICLGFQAMTIEVRRCFFDRKSFRDTEVLRTVLQLTATVRSAGRAQSMRMARGQQHGVQ